MLLDRDAKGVQPQQGGDHAAAGQLKDFGVDLGSDVLQAGGDSAGIRL
jgi:hypothetical protein